MINHSLWIAPEVVDCIAEGREPTDHELVLVGDRIWTDVKGSRRAVQWSNWQDEPVERALVLKAARAALGGNGR